MRDSQSQYSTLHMQYSGKINHAYVIEFEIDFYKIKKVKKNSSSVGIF
jgi:hypothetical protein